MIQFYVFGLYGLTKSFFLTSIFLVGLSWACQFERMIQLWIEKPQDSKIIDGLCNSVANHSTIGNSKGSMYDPG